MGCDTIGYGHAGIRKPDSRIGNPILRALGPVTVKTIPIPHDCGDGFLGAHWRRPAVYLDERVPGAISTFAKLSAIGSVLNRLSADVHCGKWRVKYGDLEKTAELDIGYRLVLAPVLQEPPGGAPQESDPRRTTL